MQYLFLVFAFGCVSSEWDAKDVPGESEAESILAGLAGQSDATIPPCPIGQWCVEAPPVDGAPLLHGVWAIHAEDVFAVGDAGTILRRTSGAWAAMPSGTSRNLRGVWASSSSDVWATGGAGTLLHYDGVTWSTVTTTSTSDVDAVWGTGPNDVWFAGGGTVQHWNGSSFSKQGFGGTMLSVSGTGAHDVWVTGENTNLHHFTGTSWTTVNPGAGTSTLLSVLALASNDVWISSFIPGKETMRWNGSKWVGLRTGGAIFNSMSALAANDIWGAGGNDVGHWNGTAWTSEQTFGSNAAMWSITTTPGHAWVVGSGALIAHRAF